MSDEVKPWQREAAAREIQRLLEEPNRIRDKPLNPSYPETDAERAVGSSMFEQLMAVAVKQTGMTREEIIALWGKEPPAAPAPRPAFDREQAIARARAAHMPDLYRQAVIERDPRPCHALEKVRTFLAGRARLLMLSGGPGTLKSGSACWAIGQVDGARYVDAIELVDVHLRDPERWSSLLGGHLVVLDDLGREDQRDGQRGLFLTAWTKLVINAYTKAKRLVVTSNLRWEHFSRYEDDGGYGVLTADRWKESGLWIDVPGESQRPALRKEAAAKHWTDREPGEEG